MATGKTLIAHATKGGVTEEAASLIAEILRNKYNLEVDTVNLGKNARPDLEQYRNVIVGSGVRMQRAYRKALKFLENKKVAIFLSPAEAGDPKSHDQTILKYVTRNLAKLPNVRPVAA
jgi:menaquinone-dependent protoporphyrinogen IX oxidase